MPSKLARLSAILRRRATLLKRGGAPNGHIDEQAADEIDEQLDSVCGKVGSAFRAPSAFAPAPTSAFLAPAKAQLRPSSAVATASAASAFVSVGKLEVPQSEYQRCFGLPSVPRRLQQDPLVVRYFDSLVSNVDIYSWYVSVDAGGIRR